MGEFFCVVRNGLIGSGADDSNSKTWMSGNDVTIAPLNCNDADGKHTCSGGPQTIIPQNVRQICNSPRC
jgi:hypothetical protein